MLPHLKIIAFSCLFICTTRQGYTQDKFQIIGQSKHESMSFKMINNLIVIPIEVNGSELNFLLDTGVDNTIMFNLSIEDSLKLKETEKVRLRGLGEGTYLNGIRSGKNFFSLKKIKNANHMIYLIPGKEFDLSSRMGIIINGIIGGDLFRDFIVDINYSSKRIRFYDPKEYSYRKCKKCQIYDLNFYRNKPYLFLTVETSADEKIDAKLLIDLGGSDALWLFDKSSDKIEVPEKYFEDYLGRGLSGNIYGKRSKIDKISLGNYIFTSANVAYPDSTSVDQVYLHKERNGTLGSEILKRFRLIIDYANKRITFKNPSSYFNDPFVYNMSGLELSHNGNMIVPERSRDLLYNGETTTATVQVLYSYVYAIKPSYIISEVRKNSPAANAGLKTKDIILKINDRPSYYYKLEEIIHLFSTKEGKTMKLLIDRQGTELTFSFKLKNIL